MGKKKRIQSLINNYLDQFGTIDILLPDGVELEIGITQEGKRGAEKHPDYCWVVTSREDRTMSLDKYSMMMTFADEDANCIVDHHDRGVVSVI